MIPTFSEDQLVAICKILGDTHTGLTGSEINDLLTRLGIEDPYPGMTKHRRLFEALIKRQGKDSCGNNVVNFIQAAISPIRYINNADLFRNKKNELNDVLSFCGYQVEENGLLKLVQKVTNLTQVEQRAKNLRDKLVVRNVHGDVLKFCKVELLQNNYFHAVFEASKSVAEKIRIKSGSNNDGSALVDEVFNVNKPILAMNTLRTNTEKSEQKGFANLLKGLFGTFRNTTAHAPKITWDINEQDALDILTLVSLLHRRLDSAVPTGLQISR